MHAGRVLEACKGTRSSSQEGQEGSSHKTRTPQCNFGREGGEISGADRAGSSHRSGGGVDVMLKAVWERGSERGRERAR